MDFSTASKRIAQTRARIRNLKNIVWITDWLETVPFLGINRFELVICSGVLHHLKRPSQGLRILNDAQLDDGGAVLMVYARYGRTSVYHIQNIMRKMNIGEREVSNEIINAKALLESLPTSNWYIKRNGILDVNMDDIEMYDRLLHKRDVCYDILDLNALIERGGYKFVDYDSPESRIAMSLSPNVIIKNVVPGILKKSFLLKQSIGGMLNGMIKQHSIYISKETESEAYFYRQGNVIFANGSPLGFQNIIHENSRHRKIGNISYALANLARKGGERKFENSTGFKIVTMPEYIGEFIFPSSEFSKFAISKLTRKPMTPAVPASILFEFIQSSKSNYSSIVLKKQLHDLYWYLKITGIFLLKKKTIPTFPKSQDPNVRFVVYDV